MYSAHGEVLVADINNLDVPITISNLADDVYFLLGYVRRRRRLRFRGALGEGDGWTYDHSDGERPE
jgi:hypothetical protein